MDAPLTSEAGQTYSDAGISSTTIPQTRGSSSSGTNTPPCQCSSSHARGPLDELRFHAEGDDAQHPGDEGDVCAAVLVEVDRGPDVGLPGAAGTDEHAPARGEVGAGKVRGKPRPLRKQESEQPLELAIARAIPCSTHQRNGLAGRSPITYAVADILEMFEQEANPLPPRHGVRVTGTYLTPNAVGIGNSPRHPLKGTRPLSGAPSCESSRRSGFQGERSRTRRPLCRKAESSQPFNLSSRLMARPASTSNASSTDLATRDVLSSLTTGSRERGQAG